MISFEPVYLLNMLREIDAKLLEILGNLREEDWHKPTLAGHWTVRDIAAHLLDGNLRTLSMLRDGYVGESMNPGESLVDFLNRLNHNWVAGLKRLSPSVLKTLLRESGREYVNYLESLDPQANAVFSVAWAGEQTSQNWFHIAREYTEKWHHLQQISEATGSSSELLKSYWYEPYLNTSVRALPYRYNQAAVPSGCIEFIFEGETDYRFFLIHSGTWQLFQETGEVPDTTVRMPSELVWKVFTRAIAPERAKAAAQIDGNHELSEVFFTTRAVMM